MRKLFSILLVLVLVSAYLPAASADWPQQNAIRELYSADGYYEDDVGNGNTYSYHVPQINADTPAAEEINSEIAEHFGALVERELRSMEGGFSLLAFQTEWEAYWHGSQLFLLVTSKINDSTDYGAYGYDFESGSRISNGMILDQMGISEEEYMEKLRVAVSELFDELYIPIPEGVETSLSYESLLKDTLGWLSTDRPIFLNRYGEIETWAEIATPAGAGKYNHLVTLPSAETHRIFLSGDTYLVESCPETARAGETVTILTCDVTDGDKEIRVSGADVVSENWFQCWFVMPDHDVEVRVEFVGNGLA